MDLGVCNDICVPIQAQLNAALSSGGTGEFSDRIKTSLADRPTEITHAISDATPISDGMRLTATLKIPEMSGEAVAIIEHPDRSIWISESQMTRNGDMVEVQPEGGGETLFVPFTHEAVPDVSIEEGRIVVVRPEEIE